METPQLVARADKPMVSLFVPTIPNTVLHPPAKWRHQTTSFPASASHTFPRDAEGGPPIPSPAFPVTMSWADASPQIGVSVTPSCRAYWVLSL